MEKIITYLNAIAKDKYQHFALGFVIAAIAFIASALWLGFWWALPVSIVIVVAGARLKEYYDKKNGGYFDCQDFAATCAGGVVLWLFAIVLWFVIR